jgi:glutathione S-transferase
MYNEAMSSQPVLIGISYSPWTAKARWALDHHGITYRYREHLVMVGMPELRLRTGKWFSGDLTVPALCAPEGVWLDSWKIARHAEEIGKGKSLFGSPDDLVAIARFNEWSETAVGAARSIVTMRIPKDPDACSEALDPIAPKFAHRALGFVVKMGTAYIAGEFGVDRTLGEAPYLAEIRKALLSFREALKVSGGNYLLGDAHGFSYADVVLAIALQAAEPVDHPSFRIKPATRKVWTTPELVSEFSDLLAWRKTIYEKHRSARA